MLKNQQSMRFLPALPVRQASAGMTIYLLEYLFSLNQAVLNDPTLWRKRPLVPYYSSVKVFLSKMHFLQGPFQETLRGKKVGIGHPCLARHLR